MVLEAKEEVSVGSVAPGGSIGGDKVAAADGWEAGEEGEGGRGEGGGGEGGGSEGSGEGGGGDGGGGGIGGGDGTASTSGARSTEATVSGPRAWDCSNEASKLGALAAAEVLRSRLQSMATYREQSGGGGG